MTMNLRGSGKQVRIYISQQDKASGGHEPLWKAVLEFLRREGASGATVIRGEAGFGTPGKLHLGRLADVLPDLPLIVEWIDEAGTVERLLPSICDLVNTDLITVADVQIIKPGPERMPLRQGLTWPRCSSAQKRPAAAFSLAET